MMNNEEMNEEEMMLRLFGKPNRFSEMINDPTASRRLDSILSYLADYGESSEDQIYADCKEIFEKTKNRSDVYEYFHDKILRVNLITGIPYAYAIDRVGEGLQLLEYITNDKEVSIPGKYKIIASGCFQYCPYIEKLTFSYGVKRIANYSRDRNKDRLKEVVLPPTLIRLEGAFRNCSNLETITFKGGFRDDYDQNNFRGTKWYRKLGDPFVIYDDILLEYTGSEKKVVIPDGVRVIGSWAFNGDDTPNPSIKEIILPESVRSIHGAAFYGCVNLKRITIPDGVEKIEHAFIDNYELEEICIPPSVKRIYDLYAGLEGDRYTKVFVADTPYLRKVVPGFEWNNVEFIDYSKEPFKIRDELVKEIQERNFSEETVDEAQELLGIGKNLQSMECLVKMVSELLHDGAADFAFGIHDMLYNNMEPYLKKYL